MTARQILKKYFGYDDFREGQGEIIDSLTNGKDVLGIMPTGAGKSVCFQVPALMKTGITLVVSPLISLMQDQVKSLIQSGIPAAYINSSLTPRQISLALYYATTGKYKIIYVAPERLLTAEFLNFAQSVEISMLTVDEAHCISQWGQDFRPSYAQIPEFLEKLPTRPVVSAFTATATKQVKQDIAEILKLKNPLVLVTGFDRKNLYFAVKQSKNKLDGLFAFLKERTAENGIVYCTARKTVEAVCDELNQSGFSAARYHAGLTAEERQRNQEDFIYDRVKIMVATNAFGMGIDKSNVNFVVHYNMPKDLESYYQEAGRAGRDGANAHCLLLYSGQDVLTNQFMIENNRESKVDDPELELKLKAREYKRLKDMTFYSTGSSCLRYYILRYFGEQPPQFCGKCSNCDTKFESVDATREAKLIINCVMNMRGSFGKTMLIDVLRGSKNVRITNFGLDSLSAYGALKISQVRLRCIIDEMIMSGYLKQTNEQYPVIKLTEKSDAIATGGEQISVNVIKEKAPAPVRKQVGSFDLPENKMEIMEILRKLRAKIARQENIPAFMVFSDATIIDMCRKMPRTPNEFMQVSGVGQKKLDRYGTNFVAVIDTYMNKNGEL